MAARYRRRGPSVHWSSMGGPHGTIAAVIIGALALGACGSGSSSGSPRPSATGAPTTTRHPPAAACPGRCIGTATADVDGDGRPDRIGYILTNQSSDALPSLDVTVRVVFADGRVSELRDTGQGAAAWIGAADVNGDHKAEVFYTTDRAVNADTGHIAVWDGHDVVQVHDAAGAPVSYTVDEEALATSGLTCSGRTFSTANVMFTAPDATREGQWAGSTTTYQWNGPTLQKVSTTPIAFQGYSADLSLGHAPPVELGPIYGVHCTGLPQRPSSLLKS